MQKEDIQRMIDLELHATLVLRDDLVVFRVVGGWIYEYLQGGDDRIAKTIFVPEPQNLKKLYNFQRRLEI